MKKIIIKIQQILCIIFDTFINFLFCIRLLHELKYELYDEHKIKTIKVLLQFLAKSFDNSAFEYYNLNNEDYLWPIYETIKKKNSIIFQLIVLLHSFLFNHFIYQIVYTIFGYSCYIDKYFAKLNKKLDKQIENNFGFIYSRCYKLQYYNKKFKNKKFIQFKIFCLEFILKLVATWNKYVIKNNHRNIFFIDANFLFKKFNELFIIKPMFQEQLEKYYR